MFLLLVIGLRRPQPLQEQRALRCERRLLLEQQIKGAGGSLDLIVNIQNPNNFTLQADKLQLGIDVEGSHLGDITYDDDFAVTQNGRTTLTLPLRFGWFGVGNAVRAALGYGDLPYTMKGQATLKLPGGAHTVVSFTHEGRAPLTRSSDST